MATVKLHDIPCRKCICYAVCKSIVMDADSEFMSTTIISLRERCSTMTDYFHHNLSVERVDEVFYTISAQRQRQFAKNYMKLSNQIYRYFKEGEV